MLRTLELEIEARAALVASLTQTVNEHPVALHKAGQGVWAMNDWRLLTESEAA